MKHFILSAFFILFYVKNFSQAPSTLRDTLPIYTDTTIANFVIKYYKGGIAEVEFRPNEDKENGFEITVFCGTVPITVYFTGKMRKGEVYKKIVNTFR